MLGEVTRTLRAVRDIVVIYSEVQRKAQARWVGWLQGREGMLVREFICVEGRRSVLVVWLVLGELCEVSIVVASPAARVSTSGNSNGRQTGFGHLAVEDSLLSSIRRRDKVLLEKLNNLEACAFQLAAYALLLEVHEGHLVRGRAGRLPLLEVIDESPLVA